MKYSWNTQFLHANPSQLAKINMLACTGSYFSLFWFYKIKPDIINCMFSMWYAWLVNVLMTHQNNCQRLENIFAPQIHSPLKYGSAYQWHHLVIFRHVLEKYIHCLLKTNRLINFTVSFWLILFSLSHIPIVLFSSIT